MYNLTAGKLIFNVDNFGQVDFSIKGLQKLNTTKSDFWRLILDDGDFKEIPVYSHQQNGEVKSNDNGLTIYYDSIIAATGISYNVSLVVNVKNSNDRLEFDANIENNDSQVKVIEAKCPFLEIDQLCGPKNKDVLYSPYLTGIRLENPWEELKRYNTGYAHKEQTDGIWRNLTYPGYASMGWFGIETGGNFLYLGRHDTEFRLCLHSYGCAPIDAQPKLMLSFTHFPVLRTGECEDIPKTVISLLEGDWRVGATIYKQWANRTFYKTPQPPKWVKEMTGWQRIIMKHQYGEILYKYDELPSLWEKGMDAGVDTLLIFGWWKGRFDNSYPVYEVDEKMGGRDQLVKAIKDIQSMGGRVILYSNGASIDMQSDFYNKHGEEVCQKDVDGNHYSIAYNFSGEGSMLQTFGYKSFGICCMASKKWKDQLVKQGNIMLDLKPDSIFYDQIGGFSESPCFNSDHAHGNRVDRDWTYRLKVYSELNNLVHGDVALGTEWLNDIAGTQVDYIHNLDSVKQTKESFPELFRHTFPEIITTNRNIQTEYDGYERDLNYAFAMGVRNCVSIYRCRGNLGLMPKYTLHLKKLNNLRKKFEEYLNYGTFICKSDEILPKGWTRTEYIHKDGTKLLQILLNTSEKALPLPYDRNKEVEPNEFDFLVKNI